MKKIPEIAMGAWAWGNDGTFGNEHSEPRLREVFDTAMANGLYLWDTAFVYGMGRAETILSDFLSDLPEGSYILSDKFTPRAADLTSETPLRDMIEQQLRRMKRDMFDIYWIHNASDAPRWTRELAEYLEGKQRVPMIGVSNHDLEEIREAESILEEHGLRLSAVQNHYSLINRFSEESGVLEYCRANGLLFFSYMVLEQGALSGKYDTLHPMPEGSARGEVYNPLLGELEPLNALLKKIAVDHKASPAQIPIAWAIAKGTIPIIGVTRPSHAEEAAAARNIVLSQKELAELEDLAGSLRFDVNRFWERQMR